MVTLHLGLGLGRVRARFRQEGGGRVQVMKQPISVLQLLK